MFNKKVTLSADGATATVVDATLSDIFVTAISVDSAVTGLYGLGQKALIGAGCMMWANKRHSGSFTNFGSKAVSFG
jgi:hypothetical protein